MKASWLRPTRRPDPGDDDPPWVFPGESAMARAFSRAGIRPGDRVGLGLLNDAVAAAALAGLPRLGATMVLFNRRLAHAELRDQVLRARLDWLVADPGHPAAALTDEDISPPPPEPPDPREPRSVLSPPTGPRRLTLVPPPADDDAPVRSSPLADPALVLFTSGTSGRPKAARLPMMAAHRAAQAAVAHLGLTPDDGWCCPLPLDHIGGAATVLRACWSGCGLWITSRFDAAEINRLLDTEPVTGISVVPTMLARLIDDRAGRPWPRRLRCLLTGGGPLDADLARRSADLGLPPSQTYGLTEACSQVASLLPHEFAAHPSSAGRPLPGVRLRIRKGDQTVANGTIGQIEVAGPTLFAGYESEGKLAEITGAWFATGDLGSVDDDGFVTIACRRDDLILSGGENIYPAEIEAVLVRHPAIAAAAVVGLPDPAWGQSVAAVLVAKTALPTDSELSAWMQANLSGYKRPRRWLWVEALPTGPGGKVVRAGLADRFAAPTRQPAEGWDQCELKR